MATRAPHVLVTGGSRGIGLAIAQLFAKNSYRCTLVSRSEKDLKAAVATLQPLPDKAVSTSQSPNSYQSLESQSEAQVGALGRGIAGNPSEHQKTKETISQTVITPPHWHSYIVGDVTRDSHFWTSNAIGFGALMPKPVDHNINHPSIIDVLVNCAGTSQANLFMTMKQGSINHAVTTNLTGTMAVTQFLLRNRYIGRRRVKRADYERPDQENIRPLISPVIINISSLLGLKGGLGAVVYAASKAGLIGFTRALATEYASHQVRVNAIAPGYVSTDMTKDLNMEDLTTKIPLGRFGTAEEVAHAALFLAQNEYAHNCVINLDGGLSAV